MRSSPIPPLYARRDDQAPKLTRCLSRGQADSRCHLCSPPDAAPRTTGGLPTTPPALQYLAARGRRSPLPPRLRRWRLLQEAPARAPRSRCVWPLPLPAPPTSRPAHLFLRLLLLLLPQSPPPPPQPPEASLPLQQAHLFRMAQRPGAEGPPLAGKGGASGGGPAPSGMPCWPGNRELPAASTRSDLLLGRRVPQAAAAGPTAEDAGRGRMRPPRAPRVGFSELTNHGEGLRGKALGAGY